ncbi:MAG: ATP-binding protein [Candidatus Thermoplasmatota archaeon]
MSTGQATKSLSIEAYVSGVATLALLLLSAMAFATYRGVIMTGPLATAPLIAVALAVSAAFFLLHRYPFTLHWREHRLVVSLDEAGVLIGLLVLPAPLLILSIVMATLVMQWWGGPQEKIKRLFNVSQYAIAATITSGAFALLERAGVAPVWGAALASLAFGLVANLLLSGVFSALSEASAFTIFRERFLVQGANSALIGIAGGLTIVALWRLHPLATLCVGPFAYLVRRYWKLHAAADRELDVHKQLANATHELMGTASISAVSARVMQECERILDCGRVELTLRLGHKDEDSVILDRTFGSGPRRLIEPLREPLPSRGGGTLGEIAVWPRQGREAFSDQESAILRTIAGQAASSLENARAIAEADAARERMDSYLSTAQDAVLLVDPEGLVKYMNPAARKIFGIAPDALLSCRASNLFDDPRLALEGGIPSEPVLVEAEAHDLGKTRAFVVEAHAGPLVERGVVAGVLMVVRDITERKRLEDEMARQRDVLTQHEKLSALGTLVAGVAHEINNPLTYMRGNLQLCGMMLDDRLKREGLSEEERRFACEIAEELKVALEGVDRITQIATSLKNVARRGTVERRPEDINQALTEVVSVVRTGIPRSVRLELDLAPGLPSVLVRVSEIHQVLLNLIKNAVEALDGRSDGVVRVRSWHHGGAVHVQVIDNGCGIPLDVQKKMFTAFFTTKEKGTGLGLNISRGIIQAHGGELMLASEVGVGTTFDLKLPAASGCSLPQASS